jgi:hypothetical protein
MRALLILPALMLAGCSTLTPGGNDQLVQGVLQNLEHCERTYLGTVGLGANASVSIKCPAMPYETVAPSATPAPAE